MKKQFIIAFFALSVVTASAQRVPLYEAYIEQYAELAQVEQARHKIPASITLAQALLESGAGQSELSLRSNNHFGIKCHNDWDGERVYHNDDQTGECFRAYDKVIDSYEDHSAFLERTRYQTLFTYEITDYKSWAYGLKAAGYATDSQYPTKLIKIIEDYELYVYDDPTQAQRVADNYEKDVETRLANTTTEKTEKSSTNTTTTKTTATEETAEASKMSFKGRNMYSIHEVKKTNTVKYVIARSNDTFEGIAKEFGLTKGQLIRYNDLPKDTTIAAGMQLYVQPKKNKSVTKAYKHEFDTGDSFWNVSQRYGIKLRKLYKLNNIPKYKRARYGVMLKLK